MQPPRADAPAWSPFPGRAAFLVIDEPECLPTICLEEVNGVTCNSCG